MKVVGEVLGNIPVDMTRVTKSGNVVLQIKAEEDVKKAVATLKGDEGKLGVEASVKDKVRPKIIITNVSNSET